jgi:YebC/PmpR family DNA-binding regulatory protein
MSGHSKWASIKHRKAKVDAQKGRLFSRLTREIIVAARMGGGKTDSNVRLRQAIQSARESSMPNTNIDRAIKRGTGELPGITYEECSYEGYGPGGVAVLVEVMTDNKNRSTSELRKIFSKHGGNLGQSGCVAWLFEKKGLIVVEKSKVPEDKLMDIVIESGGEDIKTEADTYEITTSMGNFSKVKNALSAHELTPTLAKLTMLAKSNVRVAGKDAEALLKLMDELESHDDVQNTYSNFDIPDEILSKQ